MGEMSMAIIQVPHDLTEVRVKKEQLKEQGQAVTEEQLIQQAIQDNAQHLLDDILDGHYFTCKLENDELVVYDVINAPTGKVASRGTSFAEDFTQDADGLWDYLDKQLSKIAGGR